MIKNVIRKFAVWIYHRTNRFVVPSEVWDKLDDKDLSVKIDISDIAVKWGTHDPEFVRASLFLRRVEALNSRAQTGDKDIPKMQ